MGSEFFIAGGTLAPSSPSYVERAADRELLAALLAGEYCYVLDSRQKGKSSLMARALERLQAEGVATVRLDLQRFGANLDPERWSASLLNAIGQDLGLTKELFAYWGANQAFGPLRRLLGALEEVVLPWLGERRMVIFIDEIDYVRSLPFPTDELFAGLRELYNRRAGNPRFRQIAFCLLGVTTPSDLIRDVRITPFNVGKRIELTDFTLAEMSPLAAGLGPQGKTLIQRVHYWTNGHPYLTQRLCQAIQQDGAVTTPKSVDRIVERLFFAPRSREEEPNLSDVARRVLESEPGDRSREEARSALLDLFEKVRTRKRVVRHDETDPLVSILKLSGLTSVVEGYLWIRNRIYYRVFDQQWVRSNQPDAELQRQRTAARRATIQTWSIAFCILLPTFVLVWAAISSRNSTMKLLAVVNKTVRIANKNAADRDSAARQAEANLRIAVKNAADRDTAAKQAEANLQVARKNAADRDAAAKRAEGNLALAVTEKHAAETNLAEANRQKGSAQHNLAIARLNEYFSNLALIQREYVSENYPRVVELLSATRSFRERGIGWDYYQRLMNLQLATMKGHTDLVSSAAFSPNGQRVVTASWDGTARVWEARTGQELATLRGHGGRVISAAFSPDGGRVVTAGRDATARVWDAGTGRELKVLKGHTKTVYSALFSPDGNRVVTAGGDLTVRVWDAGTGRELTILKGHTVTVNGATFSPEGKRVVTASNDNTARVWEAETGREVAMQAGHTDRVNSAGFSPDGSRVVTASVDSTARMWDAGTGRELTILKGHTGTVYSARFSLDGHCVVTASTDHTARVWDAGSGSTRRLSTTSKVPRKSWSTTRCSG